MRFYKCMVCGNVVDLLEVGGGQLVCCGQPMTELTAQEADQSLEKHVPVVEVNGTDVKVTVGSTLHPMEENHYITKIIVTYNDKVLRANLKPGTEPVAYFKLDDEVNTLEVYEYCNIHNLWKSTYTK